MRIVGDSMAPAFRSGQLVWIDAQGYRQRSPQHGDVVAARPVSFGGRALIKRVVGLPHEQIALQGLSWPLRADQFFLLGDSPQHSTDSRHFGPVSRAELIGPVRARLWPWTLFTPEASAQ